MAFSDSLFDWNGTGIVSDFEDTCFKRGYMEALQLIVEILIDAGIDRKIIQQVCALDDSPLDTGN